MHLTVVPAKIISPILRPTVKSDNKSLFNEIDAEQLREEDGNATDKLELLGFSQN
jgi:hypothetical protein